MDAPFYADSDTRVPEALWDGAKYVALIHVLGSIFGGWGSA